jgi:hypothetical protein
MRLLYCFLGLFYLSVGFAQTEPLLESSKTKNPQHTVDTSYIKDISDKLIIKINSDSRVDSYTIKDKDNSSTTIRPNNRKNYFFSVDYKFIGFSIGLPKSWSESDYENYLKGKTTDFNLNFTFFLNKWVQAVYYNSTKGYYIESSDQPIQVPTGETRPYPQLPNFKIRRLGGSTTYAVNGNKFSYRSFLQQTQIQKKNAGSILPSLSYEYFFLTDKSDDYSTESYKKNLSLTASIGYQYNWVVFKNLNFSGGITTGYGLGYVKSYDPAINTEEQYWEKKINLNFNVNLNYQWKNAFCGIQVSSLNSFSQEADYNIRNTINYENIYLGYRFDAPRIIKKPVTWLEKKLF